MASADNSPATFGPDDVVMAKDELRPVQGGSPMFKSEGDGDKNPTGNGADNGPAAAGSRGERSPLAVSSSDAESQRRRATERDNHHHHHRRPRRRGSRQDSAGSSSSASSCSTCTSRAGSQTSRSSSLSRPQRRRGRRSSISSITSVSSSSSSASTASTSRSRERPALSAGFHKKRARRPSSRSPELRRSATPPGLKLKKPLRPHPHSAPATPAIPLTITDQTDASRKGLAQNLRTTHSVLIQFGLVNGDGQPFPISAENLASYIDIQAERMRRGAIQFSSLNWYLHSMRKLHNENNWEWDSVRKAPIVTKAWNAAKALTSEAASVRATKRATKANQILEQMAATESQKAASAAQLKTNALSGASTPIATTAEVKRVSGEQPSASHAAIEEAVAAHGRAIDFSGRNPSMILDPDGERVASGRKRTYSHHSAVTAQTGPSESNQYSQSSAHPGHPMAGFVHPPRIAAISVGPDGSSPAGSVEPTAGKRKRRDSVLPSSHYQQLQHQQLLARQATQEQQMQPRHPHHQLLPSSARPSSGLRAGSSAPTASFSDADIDDIIQEARSHLERWSREQQHRHGAAVSRQHQQHPATHYYGHHQPQSHHSPPHSHTPYPPPGHPASLYKHHQQQPLPPQPSTEQLSQPPASDDVHRHHDSSKRRWHYYHPHHHRSDPPTRPPEHNVQNQAPLIFLPPIDTYPGAFSQQHLQPIAPRPSSGADSSKMGATPPVLTARQKTAAMRKKNAAAKKAAAAEVAAASAAAAVVPTSVTVDVSNDGSPGSLV
ncbi:hypothetical protein HDU86_004434 [Geranomyces michiganensis]|nr:hypothetical protein HDU86_004434 [Geranomyces michiganensis]